ncbi:MAG TPA: POTRA domain-containing protein [Pirellulales bacterium]|jgi:hypothetical protein|nr:POTRA domain-containing protein [Pirellulales bacterium]
MRILASAVVSLSLFFCIDVCALGANVPVCSSEAPKPPLQYVKFFGNTIAARHLNKRLEFKPGSRANPRLIKAGRKNLELYLRSKGFSSARVIIAEGAKEGDVGVVYVINEGAQ